MQYTTFGALNRTLTAPQLARRDHVSALAGGTPYRQIGNSALVIAGGHAELQSPKLHPVA
jgi:hypothetical protein